MVWNIFYFPIYWVANHPNWLSYFSEGWPNHQPVVVWRKTTVIFQRRNMAQWKTAMIPVDSQWIFHGKWLALKETQQGLIDPLLTIAKNSQNFWFIWIYSDLYWFIVIYMDLYWFIVIYCSYLDVPPNLSLGFIHALWPGYFARVNWFPRIQIPWWKNQTRGNPISLSGIQLDGLQLFTPLLFDVHMPLIATKKNTLS